MPPSASPSHYSKEATGVLIGAGVFALVICIAWGYIYHKGGPKEMLRAYLERRKAKPEVHDIEMARAENVAKLVAVHNYERRREQNKARQNAEETINTVTMANGLVGSMVTPPQRVDFRQDWDKGFEMQRVHVQQGKAVRKDSMDLAIEPAVDPMSFATERGKDVAALYR